jgi:hypothetical protein
MPEQKAALEGVQIGTGVLTLNEEEWTVFSFEGVVDHIHALARPPDFVVGLHVPNVERVVAEGLEQGQNEGVLRSFLAVEHGTLLFGTDPEGVELGGEVHGGGWVDVSGG